MSDNKEQEKNHMQASTARTPRKPSMTQLLHFQSNLIITNNIRTESAIITASRMTTRYAEYYLYSVPKLHAARYFMQRHFRLSDHHGVTAARRQWPNARTHFLHL